MILINFIGIQHLKEGSNSMNLEIQHNQWLKQLFSIDLGMTANFRITSISPNAAELKDDKS